MKLDRLSRALFFLLLVLYIFKFDVNNVPIVYIYAILVFIILIPLFVYNKQKLDLPMLLFGIYLVSQTLLAWVIWGIWEEHVFKTLLLVVGNIGLYIIFLPYLTLKGLVNIISLAGILYIPFSFYELINTQSIGIYRYTSTFSDPNYYGILVLLFMTAFLLKIFVFNSKIAFLYLILFIMCIFVLFFTFSRSVYLSLLVYFISLFYIGRRDYIKKFSKYFSIIFLTMIIFIYLSVNRYGIFNLDRIISFLEWRFFSKSEIESGFSRLNEIVAGINFMTSEFPLSLIGTGTGSTEVHAFYSQYYITFTLIEPRIHNTFFAVLIENGIVGFLLFIFLLYRSFMRVRKHDSKIKPYSMALFLSFLASSMFIWNLYYLPFYIAIFYIPMLAGPIHSLRKNKVRSY